MTNSDAGRLVKSSQVSIGQKLGLIFKWGGPYLLAGLFYAASYMFESATSLRTPILDGPVPESVYRWLLVMVLLAVGWLIVEFLSVSNRESTTAALQSDAVVSSLSAIVLTGIAGWFLGKGTLEWWFLVPWIASIFDAVTASWMGINNAAQKPFLSQRGTT